jgi:hypothetical protein
MRAKERDRLSGGRCGGSGAHSRFAWLPRVRVCQTRPRPCDGAHTRARHAIARLSVALIVFSTMASNNIFALLDNDDGVSAAPAASTRGAKKAAVASSTGAKKAPLSGFPGEQPAGKHAVRVPDRQKETHSTEGGARGGRPAGRGGRGGRGGAQADPSVRQFDRRGAPTKHAPSHAHRDGAALGPEGGVEAVKSGDSVADVVEIIAEDVPEMVIENVDPEDDGTQTYDQYLASKRKVDDDLALQVREVIIDEEQFQKVKPLVREGEEAKAEEETEEERAARRKGKAKRVLHLDQFRGGREADAKYRPASPST